MMTTTRTMTTILAVLTASALVGLSAAAGAQARPAPSLAAPQDEIQSVWYAPAPVTSPRFEGPAPTEASDVDAHIAATRQVYAARFDQQARRPFTERVEAVGARVVYASPYAPAAYVRGDAAALERVGALPEVAWMAPPAEYGPEQDSSARTIRAYEVGHLPPLVPGPVTGSGIKIAVLEKDSIQDGNPYLLPVTYLNSPILAPYAKHPTAIAGILAGQHPQYRGISPGVSLVSANAGSWGEFDLLIAADWSINQGVHAINASFGSDSLGTFKLLDRYFDHVVRNLDVNVIKGAGNTGGYVVSPGLGYNSITVGNSDDKKTADWSDDVVSLSSSYLDPVTGHPKPEIVAPGTGLWGLLDVEGGADWTGFIGGGGSYAGPQGNAVAALIMEREPALKLWPEAVKATILASAWHKIQPALVGDRDGVGQLNAYAADAVVRSGARRLRYGLLTPASFDAAGHHDIPIELDGHSQTRAVLSWCSDPAAVYPYSPDLLKMDLDLVVLDPAMKVVAQAHDPQAAFEIVRFLPPQGGTYTFRLVSVRFEGSTEPFGLAVSQESDSPGAAWPVVWTDMLALPW